MHSLASRTPNRLLAVVVFALLAAIAAPQTGFAQQKDHSAIKLFKIITTKDDIIVGVSKEDIPGAAANAATPDLGAIAEALNASGYITAWVYTPRRGPKGEAQQAASRRVSLFAQSIVRVEEYATDQEVIPPGK